MNRLHQKFLTKSNRYRTWHNHHRHPFWHWTVFASFAILVSLYLTGAITNYTSTLDFQSIPVVHAAGNTYYASPSGSGSACSSSFPCALTTAVNLTSPGDTVVALDGTYSTFGEDTYILFVRRGGLAGNSLTIKSLNKGGAILNCGGKFDGYAAFGFNDNISYVTVQDFRITNCDRGFHINANNDHITVKGNELYDIQRGINVGSDSDYVVIDSNIVHDFGCPDLLGQCHAIYPRGIDATIQNNIVYNNLGSGGYIHFGSYGVKPSGTWKIVNNTLIGVGTWNHWQIVAYDNDITTLIIDNNISYNDNYEMVRLMYASAPTGGEIKNNLVSSSASLCSGTPCASLAVSGNIQNTNPLLTDPVNNDYTLTASSPAKDAALATYAPSLDLLGVSRPQGSAYDIGAYEYVSGGGTPPDTTPPSAPTGVRVQ